MPATVILVVDDDKRERSLLKQLLRGQGYRVLEAANGLQALSVCACHPVDLLVAKTQLPGINGRQLVETLGRPFGTMRVIYLSAGEDPGEDFVATPIEPAAVLEKVRRLLDTPPKKPSASSLSDVEQIRALGEA